MPLIYLDNNATTPIDPAVTEAMEPFLQGGMGGVFGNPSSGHEFGRTAREAMDVARGQVAGLLSCRPDEIVFTGCGSEADNLAIKGTAEAYGDRGNHIITCQIEHPAVLKACRYLERRGFEITYLPVDQTGQVDPEKVQQAITSRTLLISIMHANNETGTIQPIAEIAAIGRQRGILVHTDAAQSVGKVPTEVAQLGVDLLTVAGHKLYAPKGIGALYVRSGVRLEPVIHGAGHEGGRRAGTENVAYIVGLGKACAVAGETMGEYVPRMQSMRDMLHRKLAEGVHGLALNGHVAYRLPNTLNVSFPKVDGEKLLVSAPSIAASTGSACHAGRTEPSGVLMAMGLPRERALGAVRLSLGKFSSPEEISEAAETLTDGWKRLVAES